MHWMGQPFTRAHFKALGGSLLPDLNEKTTMGKQATMGSQTY
jgi:hypothetical protein